MHRPKKYFVQVPSPILDSIPYILYMEDVHYQNYQSRKSSADRDDPKRPPISHQPCHDSVEWVDTTRPWTWPSSPNGQRPLAWCTDNSEPSAFPRRDVVLHVCWAARRHVGLYQPAPLCLYFVPSPVSSIHAPRRHWDDLIT